MKRRDVIALFAGAALSTPLISHAQNTNKATKRIVFVPDPVPAILADWRADMGDLGWTDGQDYIVIKSEIESGSLIQAEAAQRIVANKPDLIITGTSASALAVQRATASIPIVMLYSGYPVEAGIADSLAKPGRNATGNAIYASMGVWGKMLQLLREVKPDIERVSVLWTYVMPAFPKEEIEPCYAELKTAARSLDLKLHTVEAANTDQVKAALVEIEAKKTQGLMLTSYVAAQAMPIVTQFAVEKGLPTIIDFDWTPFLAPPRPLLSYAPVYRELVRSAVASVNKILRGSSPSDMPIMQPSRFELVVDLVTANSMGLSIPQALLFRADRVNE
jgi:putative tryptophan/tyrosine transport system substrate-binding protein